MDTHYRRIQDNDHLHVTVRTQNTYMYIHVHACERMPVSMCLRAEQLQVFTTKTPAWSALSHNDTPLGWTHTQNRMCQFLERAGLTLLASPISHKQCPFLEWPCYIFMLACSKTTSHETRQIIQRP